MEFSSNHLDFRLLKAADREIFISLYQDPKVMRKIGPVLSEEKAEALFEIALARNKEKSLGQKVWTIYERSSERNAGLLMLRAAKFSERAEVGVILTPSMNLKGYGREAVKAIINVAHKWQLSFIFACYKKDHLAVEKSLVRLGFAPVDRTIKNECGTVLAEIRV